MSEPSSAQEQLNQLNRENERLRRENQELTRHMALLRTVARTIVDEPNKAELTMRLAELVADLLKTERVMVGTLVREVLEVDQELQQGRFQPVNLRFQPGEGIAGWVMIYKRPYLGPPVLTDPPQSGRSVLAVPILNHQGFILGVIECHRSSHSLPFSDKEANLLQTIALQTAPGLERAQLFDQMERWVTF
ncbi:MAG: GAF domain-containing protein [Anaerolineae bacterium]